MPAHDWREITGLANRVRSRICNVGTLHAMWCVVFDLEALSRGSPSILDRNECVRIAKEFLGEK